MKRIALLAAIALSGLSALPLLAHDPTIRYHKTDPDMNRAIAQARDSLPVFLRNALTATGEGVPGSLIKVGLPTVNGVNDLEHIWVSPFLRRADGSFVAVLANDPVELGDLRIGDQVAFGEDGISDWSLSSPEGLLYGNYTSRVMFDRGAFGDTPFDAIFTANPVPAGWK